MQSLQRFMSILRVLSGTGKEKMRLTEIASAIGLAKPTVDRLLDALCREGLVERDATDKTYRLGHELVFLGLSAASVHPMTAFARPVLEELAATTGDGIFMGMRAGYQQVCTDRVFGDYPVKTEVFQVGGRRPIGVGANGLAILGCMPAEEVEEILQANEPALAAYPGFTPEWIREQVAHVREHGYCYTEGRIVPEANALAMPVRESGGRAICGIAIVSVPSRFANGRLEFLKKELRGAVARLESLAGNGRGGAAGRKH